MNRSGPSMSKLGVTGPSSAVNECVRYIICREGSKIPIKQSDIRAHLENNISVPRNEVKTILSEANKVLKKVYGYKLVQIDAKEAKYIVVLDEPSNSTLSTYINPQHRKLLIAALIHIYMTGTPVKEDDMWIFLIHSQLMKENELEKKKILTKTFVQQTYLKYTKVGNETCEFDWGQRAHEEIPKIFLLNKMAEAFNVDAKYWSEQYRKAVAESGEQEIQEVE